MGCLEWELITMKSAVKRKIKTYMMLKLTDEELPHDVIFIIAWDFKVL